VSAGGTWKALLPAWLPSGRVDVAERDAAPALPASGPRVLLVVPHPDDEYYFAATVYRITHELGGTVDQVVITNGAGGHRYAQLAERYYGVTLHGEGSRLARIRRDELRRAGRILGIRKQHLLDECDECYTLDAEEGLSRIWNRRRIVDFLRNRLAATRYDYVFTILPSEATHGHHKSAALLVLEAVAGLNAAGRPVVLGAEPGLRGETPRVRAAEGAELSAEPVIEFDRTRRTGAGGVLSYEIVVNWVIAEHKSQGAFQNDYGRHEVERYWLLGEPPPGAPSRLASLRAALNPEP
jgi:LmbE family N-acetylglucosaminyl deacetylase